MTVVFTLYGLTISAVLGCLITAECKYMQGHRVSVAVMRATIEDYESLPAGGYIDDLATRQFYRDLSRQVRGSANGFSVLLKMISTVR